MLGEPKRPITSRYTCMNPFAHAVFKMTMSNIRRCISGVEARTCTYKYFVFPHAGKLHQVKWTEQEDVQQLLEVFGDPFGFGEQNHNTGSCSTV